MNAERLQQIESLFHAALDRAEDERAAYLRAVCGDELLRSEVETLLMQGKKAGDFIELPAMELAAREMARDEVQGRHDLTGKMLGTYRVGRRIGAGGMGEVYAAEDSRLGRQVAVKLLPAAHTAHPGCVRRFQQEARAASALNHPNIVTIYDLGHADGIYYMATELVQGTTLRQILSNGRMAVREAVGLGVQIARALAAAHEAGIVHRDIKPENLMVRPDGYVKVLDFGLAKLREQDPATTLTTPGLVMGTMRYMSPEQARGLDIDARSDLFSLGIVLYELVTGRHPFHGETGVDVAVGILDREPAPLGMPVPGQLESIIRRSLRKDREQRYSSSRELLADLKRLQQDLDSSTSASPTAATSKPSIAVLPFTSMSGDKENEYFSDGLAEEILNALARIPELRVTARTSSFAFRGKEQDIRRIASILDVETILEGSVRRAGNRIRVTAQLIDATNGYHLWSERYDREMEDVFAVQDEIAQAIALALKVKLAPTPVKRQPKVPAYEAYLKARHLMAKWTPEGLARGRECMEQAISLDPEFALAHARLGAYYAVMASRGLMPAREALPRALASAQTALSIDPTVSDARSVLGMVAAMLDYDWEEAGRQHELALACQPVSVTACFAYGTFYLLPLGRIPEAIRALERALREDPLHFMYHVVLGCCYWAAGKADRALAHMHQATELEEHNIVTLFCEGVMLAERGKNEEALVLAEKAHAVAPRYPAATGLLAALLSRTRNRERADQLMQTLGAGEAYGAPLGFLNFFVLRSEVDPAIGWARKAVEQRDPAILLMYGMFRSNPVMKTLGPDLARMINLPV
jgi:serine/threonine protein kinase/tetratricopeptide (TPR) repeat protein